MLNPIKTKPQYKGYLCLVFHAHLPYIRHHDRDDFMEERWFYEAMMETYLPLLEVFERLVEDQVDFRITLSMTPTLLSLCSDALMQQRFLSHLDRLIELADKETMRLRNDASLLPLAKMYAMRFRALKALYVDCGQNIIVPLKHLQDRGKIEIITSAATHAFLPLCKTEEAIHAQIATAVKDYNRYFGRDPRGIWLPECGYTQGIDRILKCCGIQYFFADTSAIQFATPRATRDWHAPLTTPYGIHAFPRDPESSRQVWSAEEGYPGDFDYREYYRDIGWDLGWKDAKEWEYIRPYVLPTYERVNTGIKYYRITCKGSHKEPYNPEWASRKAAEHADHFIHCRQKQVQHASSFLDRTPIMVSPYDAELFGHWWYEGPHWIEMLCRKIFHDQHIIKMVTPSEYLEQYPFSDTGKVNDSSWGRNHSAEVWLQGNNDWIYRHLHQAEERMISLATRYHHLAHDEVHRNIVSRALNQAAIKISLATGYHYLAHDEVHKNIIRRALNQAAREFMLAQSSDWAFIMDSQTVVDYAVWRTKDHLHHFHTLCGMIEKDEIEYTFLEQLEQKHHCFPAIDYSDYASIHPVSPVSVVSGTEWEQTFNETKERPNIFMLAWEYPPKNVGGLSRAVCELSEALAAQGEIVHVITSSFFGAPYFEKRNGVYVHRVPVLTSGDTDFYHWVFEMNLAMTDHLVRWKEGGGRIDIIHAHDWMVFQTAREIKHSFDIPLVATLHATEWGRNQGKISTHLQQQIHRLEWNLTYEASRVFVCSEYMADEVCRLFKCPRDKIHIFPNGIHMKDASKLLHLDTRKRAGEKIVFFVGRLVFEKGVHVLIDAIPGILQRVPNTKFIIAGMGPMSDELKRRAAYLGDRVVFTGFIEDAEKESLYLSADVCVVPSLYEPFGIVALEAMKNHKPLVISDTGGLAEIVEHGKDGFKTLPGNVDSLSYHISEVLLDPELGHKAAAAAFRKLVQYYQWPGIAEKVNRVYHSLYRTCTEEEIVYAASLQ